MGRAGWLLVLLLAPALLVPQAEGQSPSVSFGRAPAWASRGGDAWVAEVAARGPPGAHFELRAELGDGERQASRFWNGTGWQTSQRYAAYGAFDGAGVWTGTIRVAANADAANWESVAAAEEGVVRVRLRVGDDASEWGAATVRWFGGDRGPAAGSLGGLATAGAFVELGNGTLAAAAVADAAGAFRLAAPAGDYELRAGSAESVRVALREGPTPWFGPEPPGRLLLSSFAFRAYESPRDDVVEVCNDGDDAASLDGAALGDGEGLVAWPPRVLEPGSCVTAVGDADAYARATGRAADASWGPGGAMASLGPGFALAHEDELELVRFGRVVDSVAWGEGRTPAGWRGAPLDVTDALGRVFRRHGADTDAAADWWSARPYRLGQTETPPATVDVAAVTAFVAPDSSYETFARLIDRARDNIVIEVYEFAHDELAGHLERALLGGNVSAIRVVVEDAPVGRTPEARDRAATVLARLQAAGADVRLVAGNRYVYHHAKVAVVDGRWTLVASENMNANGFPPARTYGNRGWGVVVDSAELARAVLGVLDADAAPHWTTPFDFATFAPDHREPLFAVPSGPYRPRFGALEAGPARVSLLVSPEHTVPPRLLLDAIDSATEEVLVEFLTLAATWRTERSDEPNPLLEALLAAAARGVRVRVLLAGDFVDDTDDLPDNLDAARVLSERGRGLDLRVRLADPDAIGTVHNKGLIVDRRVVHVGSLNGNLHSASRNRELGVVLESREAASYFARAFDHDWAAWGDADRADGGSAGPGAPSRAELGLVATLFTVGLVLVARRRPRGRSPGP